MVARTPASRVAAEDGTSADQYSDKMKYTNQAPLFRLVSMAQDQDTPAGSRVRRNFRICGRYCGIPNPAATIGR